jgi:signal peptidase II
MNRSIIKFACIVFILAAGLSGDFFSKKWATNNLKNKPPVVALKNFIDIGFVENRGMVFGILNRGNHPYPVVSAVTWVRLAVCIGVSVYIGMKIQSSFIFLLPFLLIWMGAVGNLIDSFTKGYVADFIHIHAGTILDWPFFFNFADAYVCFGAAILLLIGIFCPKDSVTTSKPKGTE